MTDGWRRSARTIGDWPAKAYPVFLAARVLMLAGCTLPDGGRITLFGGGDVEGKSTVTDWSMDGFTGRRITTDHFEVFSTLHDTAFEAALPGFVEAAYRRYEGMLPPAHGTRGTEGRSETDAVTGPEEKLTTYIFGSRREWERFVRPRYPHRFHVYERIQSGGFTEGSTAVLFYVTRGGTWATLAHEGWHQYVSARLHAPIPAWLNEGLACYHESVEFSGPRPRFKPMHNTFRVNSLREAIQTDALLPLREIVQTDAGRIIGTRHGQIAQYYYAQVWALITFLRHGAGKRLAAQFERMLGDIADGTFAVRVSAVRLADSGGAGLTTAEAVFPAYFGCRLDELAERYRAHLLKTVGF